MSEAEAASREQRRSSLDRVWGTLPWLRPSETKRYRVKVFKSGNSLALRLPAGLGLKAGMEMDLETDGRGNYSFEPVEQPRRKFAIDKVAGSATSLKPIRSEDRVFAERALLPLHRESDDASGIE